MVIEANDRTQRTALDAVEDAVLRRPAADLRTLLVLTEGPDTPR